MSTLYSSERHGRDHILLATVFLLAGLGLVTLYSSSYAFSQRFFNNGLYLVTHQMKLGLAGIALLFIASVIDLEILRKFVKPLVLGCIILCILTFVPGIGVTKNGASRWIGIGSYTFQPSELVKLVLPLYLAHILEKKKDDIDIVLKGLVPPALITGVFFVLIFLQNNISTAIFLAINALFMFFLAGVRFRYFFSAILMFVPTAALLILKKEHRVRRFLSYIQPEFEPLGAGYQVNASILTISSGGFWGKGVGQGTRKISSVPEIHSDFIFSSYAEEFGFLGVILFSFLFTVFAVRGFASSMGNEKPFYRLLGCALVTMIVSQVLLNIAVISGALPATGIPLPFFSAGGSSLLTTMMMSGLVLNISRFSRKGSGANGSWNETASAGEA